MFLAFLLINLSRSKVSDEGYICIVEYILFMILWLPVFNFLPFMSPSFNMMLLWVTTTPKTRSKAYLCFFRAGAEC